MKHGGPYREEVEFDLLQFRDPPPNGYQWIERAVFQIRDFDFVVSRNVLRFRLKKPQQPVFPLRAQQFVTFPGAHSFPLNAVGEETAEVWGDTVLYPMVMYNITAPTELIRLPQWVPQ